MAARPPQAVCYSQFCEYERSLGGKVEGDFRFKAHLLLPWLWDLAHHPRILATVEAALGTAHLLLWSSDFFVKEPGGGAFTSWHQDSTYVALSPEDAAGTVWVALTPSTRETGCLEVIPGSHGRQLAHAEVRDARNILLKGQTVAEALPGGGAPSAVAAELRPGEFSLHHLGAVHRSGANAHRSQRRVGVALRYMGAHCRQGLDPRDSVVVAQGPPLPPPAEGGLYEVEPRPTGDRAQDGKAHARAVQRVYPEGHPRAATRSGY